MVSSELLKEFGFKEEFREIISDQFGLTGFPQSKKKYKLTLELYDLSLEEPYFWVLGNLKDAFPIIEKLEDSFAAAENSAFFGVTQQRLGAQQDKITQIIVGVGKLVKELFQIVRELRIIKERLTYYKEADQESEKQIDKRGKSAEITLKGLFVDLVQGGGKSPASVYGMARELEFITLPDLFFDAPPFRNTDELESHVKGLEKDFNKNVLRVLIRHLRQFMEWKKRTSQEHKNREVFQLKYLQQHYEVIQMYLTWLKPYLRNVNKLSMKEKNMLSVDLISAFEGSMLDIEILAAKESGKITVGKEVVEKGYDCVLTTFNYRTRPEMKVVQEGYQRGPVHVGKMEMHMRVYRWTDDDIKRYKKLKEKETMLLMGSISSSLQEAMESLGDELIKYLDEAKGVKKEEETETKKPVKKSFMEMFLGDFYTPQSRKPVAMKKPQSNFERKKIAAMEEFRKGSPGYGLLLCFNIYKTFKKAHRMVMW